MNLHSFLQQLFAEGYNVGDRVVGRCLEVTSPDVEKPKNLDWHATLTEDNLNLTEYRWTSKGISPHGKNHPDGLSWLKEKNDSHFGIYYNINGGRTNATVKRFYTIAWEDDKTSLDAQRARAEAFPLKPTTGNKTRRSFHVKYRVRDEDCAKELWGAVQEEMSLAMASDPTIKDLPRLMRCAGFDHIKWVDGAYELTPCVLEICEPERIYTLAEVKEAMAAFAPQPFSQLRYRAYNFAIGKLNQRKRGIQYPLIDPEAFRTCPESELGEKFCRLKLYARLCELEHLGKGDGTDPATAWTQPLKKVRNRYKKEVDVKTVDASVEQVEALDDPDEHLVLRWARRYGEGWSRAGSGGRYHWDTCRCPVHGSSSNSYDNLHVNRADPNYNVGALSCKSGCDAQDIIKALRQRAKDAGDETWNWNLKDRANAKPENNIVPGRTPEESRSIVAVQAQLRAFTQPVDLEFNQQYLPDNLDQKLPKSGVVLFKSAKGSGKSTVKKKVIAQGLSENRPVISLGARIALGKEQAATWGIHYIDNLPKKFTIENAPSLGLCFDSLLKLLSKDLTNAIVIIDEAEQGLTHLINSGTCRDRRPRLLAAFEVIIQKVLESGGLVILSDADLSDVSVNYIKSLSPKNTPTFTVVNNHKGKQWEVNFFTGNRSALQRRFVSSINAGHRIVIATDSQAEAEKAHKLIEKECPGKKVIRVDGKTSYLEVIQRFMKNINVALVNEPPDVLIYTSSMGAGVSIDVPWCDEVYGFFFGQVEPSQCRQMLGRPRHPVPRFVWAVEGNHQLKGDKSFLPSEIKQNLRHYHEGGIVVTRLAEELARSKAESQNETNAQFLQRVIQTLEEMMAPDGTWQNAHLDLHVAVKARNNYSLKNLAPMLAQELVDEGHNVETHKLSLLGLRKLVPDGNPISVEIPIQASERVLKQLATPLDETAETETQEALTPEHDDPLTSLIEVAPCSPPPLTQAQRQVITEALAFTVNDEAKNVKTKEAMAELKKEKLKEEVKRLAEAEEVEPEVAFDIMRDPFATEDERYQAQKTLLAQSLPELELTPKYLEKVVVVDRQKKLTQFKNFWRLTHPEETKRKDRQTWIHHLKEAADYVPFLPDIHTHEPKFEVLRQIGLLQFLADPTKEYCATDPTVKGFFETCLKLGNKLKTTWGIGVSRKHTSPIDLINRLLDKIGLRLKKTRQTRQGDDRIRYYALDEALLNDPDRLATLAALDRKNVAAVPPQTLTPQGLTPEHDAPNNYIYKESSCATPNPQVSTPPVPVRGKTIRIYANALYSEAMGVVVQGSTSADCVKARIISGEYAGAEWVVSAGEYALV